MANFPLSLATEMNRVTCAWFVCGKDPFRSEHFLWHHKAVCKLLWLFVVKTFITEDTGLTTQVSRTIAICVYTIMCTKCRKHGIYALHDVITSWAAFDCQVRVFRNFGKGAVHDNNDKDHDGSATQKLRSGLGLSVSAERPQKRNTVGRMQLVTVISVWFHSKPESDLEVRKGIYTMCVEYDHDAQLSLSPGSNFTPKIDNSPSLDKINSKDGRSFRSSEFPCWGKKLAS